MSLLTVSHIKKIYTTRFSSEKVEALRDINFTVEKGEFIAIMGESGSGKTTLLNILATLLPASSGEVVLDGKNFSQNKESQAAEFRRENLGFVFQEFNLLDTLSVEDNIYLPLVLSNISHEIMKKNLEPIAETLRITNLLKKYPYEISGGQKQRVAVARAIITKPKLLLADEPTGALDSKSSDELLFLLHTINNQGKTILMVTHSAKAASCASRVLFISDGEVFHQIYKGENNNQEFYQKISDSMILLQNRGVKK